MVSTKSVALIMSLSCIDITNSYVIYKRNLVRAIPESGATAEHITFLVKWQL